MSTPRDTAGRRYLPVTRKATACCRYSVIRHITEHTARTEGPESVRRAALWLECLAIAGDDERLAAALAVIDAAVGARALPKYPQAAFDETVADGEEDDAEAAFRLTPSETTARALVRASAAARLRMETREAALRLEYGL